MQQFEQFLLFGLFRHSRSLSLDSQLMYINSTIVCSRQGPRFLPPVNFELWPPSLCISNLVLSVEHSFPKFTCMVHCFWCQQNGAGEVLSSMGLECGTAQTYTLLPKVKVLLLLLRGRGACSREHWAPGSKLNLALLQLGWVRWTWLELEWDPCSAVSTRTSGLCLCLSSVPSWAGGVHWSWCSLLSSCLNVASPKLWTFAPALSTDSVEYQYHTCRSRQALYIMIYLCRPVCFPIYMLRHPFWLVWPSFWTALASTRPWPGGHIYACAPGSPWRNTLNCCLAANSDKYGSSNHPLQIKSWWSACSQKV